MYSYGYKFDLVILALPIFFSVAMGSSIFGVYFRLESEVSSVLGPIGRPGTVEDRVLWFSSLTGFLVEFVTSSRVE